jgi:hypothetical protein
MTKFAAVLTIALGLSAASCYGDLFDFSYTFDSSSFGSGTVIAGTFDGTANGNLISNIYNASLTFDGSSFGTIFYVANVEADAPAVISFNGAQNDFVFGGSAGDLFLSDTGPQTSNAVIAVDLGSSSLAFGAIDSRYWSIVDTSTKSVPDSGTTVILLGLGLVGLACVRRWKPVARA